MQITDHTGAAILADGDHDVLLGDGDLHDNVVDHGDQQDSLESLCQVWRLSRSDPLPHICSSISNIIHINSKIRFRLSVLHVAPGTKLKHHFKAIQYR